MFASSTDILLSPLIARQDYTQVVLNSSQSLSAAPSSVLKIGFWFLVPSFWFVALSGTTNLIKIRTRNCFRVDTSRQVKYNLATPNRLGCFEHEGESQSGQPK